MNNLDHQESDSESGDMSIPPVQSVEDFWGLELNSKKKKLEWETDDNDDEIDIDKTLELRQACLGAMAKEGERNVVQITTENDEGEEVTHTILSMKVGLNEQSALFLTLRPPVVFELVSGSGPVHIVGNVTESLGPLIDSESESSDDEGEISSPEVKALQAAASKKRPAESPAKKPAAKVAKVEGKDKEEEEDEMETSEDEEEDDSEEEEEEEDEDEESEDEEEDEEETKPPPKKQQANGKLKGKPAKAGDKGTTFKTPQVAGNKKAPIHQRGTQSAPTTPKVKGDKKKGGPQPGKSTTAPGVLTADQMKQRLLKMSPHIPKKLEKFNNFVSNAFKVKDDATKKHLWEFVQKNRSEK